MNSLVGPQRGSHSVRDQCTVVVPADIPHRLFLAALNGLPYLAPDIAQQLRGFLTVDNFAFIAAVFAADIAFVGTGVGTVLNVLAGGLMVVFVGREAISGFRDLTSFYRIAVRASSAEDFQVAGQKFASAITRIGVTSLMIILTRQKALTASGKVLSNAPDNVLKTSWFALIDSIKFDVPENQGVIWQGMKDWREAKVIAKAGNPHAKVLNEVLEKNGFQQLYDQEFGKDWSALTYRIWERVSIRYVQSLKGKVTAYVENPTKLFRERLDPKFDTNKGFVEEDVAHGAGKLVEFSEKMTGKVDSPAVLITELEELVSSNNNITAVIVKDARSGQEIGIYTPKVKSSHRRN